MFSSHEGVKMTPHDNELSLINDVIRGRLSRRSLLVRGAALGLSVPTIAALATAWENGASAQTAPAGELVFALESPPPNVIPFGAIALAQWHGKEFMYDSLLEWDESLAIQPAIAESYETPDDTTYIFHIRKGVLFHDGAEVKAADVKYSLDMAVTPPEPGAVVPYLANIAGVEVVDDYTVKVTMSKVDPTLPGVLAWSNYTPIVPAGIYDRINVLSEGIGTGPFKLAEYVQDDVIVYEANPEYWKPGVPCVSKITLKSLTDEQSRVAALRSGEIDGGTFTPDVVLTLEGDEELEVLRGITSAPRVIHFNTVNDVPWRDVRVRQAISLCVDRQLIIDNVYGGNAELTNAVPPGYGEYPLPPERLAELYVTDVEKAKALMAEAGLADGFAVTLQAISAPREYTQIAEIVREQLKEINIDVTVEPLEIGTFAKNIGDGTFEWASTGRGMRGDPSGYVIDFRSGTPLHQKWFGEGWKNDEIDRIYDEALTTLDQSLRPPMYHQIQELIATDVPNMYTVQPYKFQVVRKRITGMYVFFGNTNPGLRTACVAAE
jgi:peptide/nickel transport system substrate-binding protein